MLHWAETPAPRAEPDEVIVTVAASAVNRADLSQRQGRYPVPPGTVDILGLECSGTISSVGGEVTGWRIGDPVCALLTGGGYAQQVAVPADQLLPIPPGVSLLDAAALPEAACTVYSNLVHDAGLDTGDTVLVHGGGSGIGTMAIQVITAMGAQAVVTCGSDERARRCLELGATAAINYRTTDFTDAVLDLTDGRGADIALDCVGGPYLNRNIDALAVDGTLLVIGLQGGNRTGIDLEPVMRRRLTIRGSTLRARPRHDKAHIVAGTEAHLWPLIAAGKIQPLIDSVVPMPHAARAHRRMEAGRQFGKILLAAPTDDKHRDREDEKTEAHHAAVREFIPGDRGERDDA
ncbi:NAD(P)H-quinone oxidoreductase [Amycolatopsis endophytica]